MDHTGNELEEAFGDMLEEWNLSERRLVAITTDRASNNVKAFAHLTWMSCFGHNLDLSVNKVLALEYVSLALSRLCKTISAFSTSAKRKRNLTNNQAQLGLPDTTLIQDVSTRWGSTQHMIERFLQQQKAVLAVLVQGRKSRSLIPTDADLTTLEVVNEVLAPLQEFTDALSGERHFKLLHLLFYHCCGKYSLCWS